MLVPSHETAPAASVLACYLVVDTSDSMAGPGLEALNVEVARLLEALRNDARLRDACQVAVITFDAEARLHLPLTPGDQLGQAPRFAATRPATNFEAAFRFLRQQIVQDVEQLRSRNLRPRRPAVFLLTDGRPTRGYWPSAHAELTDQSWSDAPDVIVFGFGEAAGPAIRRIGTAGAYLPASAAGVAQGGPAGMLSVLTTFVRDAIHSPLGRPPSDPPRRSAPDAGDALPPTSQRARPGWRSLDEVRR
jgi:uncharacterized protein YegL